MILNGKTDVGLRRKNNQDSFVIRQWNDIGCALGVVCDGMGGANGGNIASALACETFVRAVERFMLSEKVKNGSATEGDYSSMLAHAVSDANQAVFRCTERDESLRGMGTTLVASLVVSSARGRVLYAVNVGDSRLYLYNRGRMTQITRDHSLVQYLLDAGKLTPEEAKDYPNRNVITRAVGIERGIEADIFSVDLSSVGADALALLCSDGLSAYVEKNDICALLREAASDPHETYNGAKAAQKLIDAANAAGGPDNITVLLIRFRGESAPDGETAASESTQSETTLANESINHAEKDGLHGTV